MMTDGLLEEVQGLVECDLKKPHCPLLDIRRFHRNTIPSKKALKYAIGKIMKIELNSGTISEFFTREFISNCVSIHSFDY